VLLKLTGNCLLLTHTVEPGDQDDQTTTEEKPHVTSASVIVAVEDVKPRATDDDDDAGKGKDAGEGDDDEDDEAGSRLVVIDKTRIVPQVDVDVFTG